VTREQARLEAQLNQLKLERNSATQQIASLQSELEHARDARAKAQEKAHHEREAHATWQAHCDEQLVTLRQRLVSRTEKLVVALEAATAQPLHTSHFTLGAAPTQARAPPAVAVAAGAAGMEPLLHEGHMVVQLAASIAEELKQERDARLCAICMHTERSTVLMPCKHALLCPTCAHTVRSTSGRCPICRQHVDDVLEVFG